MYKGFILCMMLMVSDLKKVDLILEWEEKNKNWLFIYGLGCSGLGDGVDGVIVKFSLFNLFFFDIVVC